MNEGCGGWTIQDLGEEGYLHRVAERGPIWCEVHKCDAWLCFAPIEKSPFPVDEPEATRDD